MLSAAGTSKTQRVLQGTITTLKLIQQIVGLAPAVPGLQSLSWSGPEYTEVVNVSFDATLDISRMCNIDIVNLKNTYAVESHLMFG